MKLIVGLGNPGKEYELTPHNVGFRVIDALKKMMESSSEYEYSGSERHSLYVIDEFWYTRPLGERERVILMKPRVFMNESGKAVADYCAGKRGVIDCSEDLWIVHDDGDILLGKARIDKGKRAAGHRGIQSIIDALSINDMIRFRVGIQPMGARQKTEQYVLKKPSKADALIFSDVESRTTESILIALEKNIDHAMNFLNKKPSEMLEGR